MSGRAGPGVERRSTARRGSCLVPPVWKRTCAAQRVWGAMHPTTAARVSSHHTNTNLSVHICSAAASGSLVPNAAAAAAAAAGVSWWRSKWRPGFEPPDSWRGLALKKHVVRRSGRHSNSKLLTHFPHRWAAAAAAAAGRLVRTQCRAPRGPPTSHPSAPALISLSAPHLMIHAKRGSVNTRERDARTGICCSAS